MQAHLTRVDAVDFRHQGRKVDADFDLGERIARLVEGLIVMLVGKQVSLDDAALLIGGHVKGMVQVSTILPGQARVRFFEVP